MNRGYDLDGVFCDFNRSFINLINQRFPEQQLPPPSAEFPDCWNYHRASGIAKQASLTNKQESSIWAEIKLSDFWAKLLPLPGAIEALNEVEGQRFNGDRVYFITQRPGRFAKLYSEWWLRNHGVSQATVIITDAKTGKGPLAAALELDFFVDDKPENCFDVQQYCPSCQVFLVDRPYNRDSALFSAEAWATEAAKIIRVPSVLDAINYQAEVKAA